MTTRISNGSLRKTTRNLLFTKIARIFLRIFQASNLSVIIFVDLYVSIESYLPVFLGASDFTLFLTYSLSLRTLSWPVLEPPDGDASTASWSSMPCDGEIKDTFVIRTLSKSPRRIKFHTRRQLIPVLTPYQVRNLHGLTFLSGISMNSCCQFNSGAIFGATHNTLAAGFSPVQVY